ncbi:CD209 antigen-like protein E isoform X2 [Thunnus albacares]|uniref:CD209 antigen-like protein E isoform X2 n=1 Tax=Thunnus albacares TaxID=8236 RepID=UPI001CF69FF3|nr:CD209 antigen-like protein E isoform X2 [Thunnus albacares]
MPENEVLYSEVKFTRRKGNTIETASSSVDAPYAEVRILKTQPSTELPGSQQVVSNRGSKFKSQRVALVVLCVLLAVVVIALCCVSYDNMQTKKSLQAMKAEHEAMKTNFTESLSEKMMSPSCPQPLPPEIKSESCLKCAKGWEQLRGKCYYFSDTYLSWEGSRHSCQNQGGDLVKIDSRVEQILLNQKLIDKMINAEDKFWIGLTDSKEENKWFWVDGSSLNTSLSFWAEREPDNWDGENPKGEDCVRMGEKAEAENLKQWFDKSCDKPHRSICEKQAVTGSRRVMCV